MNALPGILIVYSIVCGIFAGYVADDKGRRPETWALLGLVFGILALITIAGLTPVESNEEERYERYRRARDVADRIEPDAKPWDPASGTPPPR